MTSHGRVHRYRVRLSGTAASATVRAVADLDHRLIAIILRDESMCTVDATTARALQIVLHTSVFESLGHIGPPLVVERTFETGTWSK